MLKLLFSLLEENGIDLYGAASLSDCKIIKPYLLDRAGISSGTAVIFAVPYLVDDRSESNISEYSKSRDYHLFFGELFDNIIPKLRAAFPENRFAGFVDHSPIDEINTAAACGLGIIGSNRLLITEKYSSFVFVGEIITDVEADCTLGDIKTCENCGLCKKACPFALDGSGCLSAITQKKSELTDDEISLMKTHGTVWGCDICQNVCPHTKKCKESGTIYTPIPFFHNDRTPLLTYDSVANMSDSDFECRAYSWRGRRVILRNLEAASKK